MSGLEVILIVIGAISISLLLLNEDLFIKIVVGAVKIIIFVPLIGGAFYAVTLIYFEGTEYLFNAWGLGYDKTIALIVFLIPIATLLWYIRD